jgi:predicted transposase YdaD
LAGKFRSALPLKELEEKEKREIRSFDSIAKVLSKDFPELLDFILQEYQVDVEKSKVLTGKLVFIKRIADVIFEAKDKSGNDVIIHMEFERKYESDEYMDKRKLEYRHLMEMDEGYEGKNVLCNVFYLKGSPASKKMVEDRTVKLPTSDPRYSDAWKSTRRILNNLPRSFDLPGLVLTWQV